MLHGAGAMSVGLEPPQGASGAGAPPPLVPASPHGASAVNPPDSCSSSSLDISASSLAGMTVAMPPLTPPASVSPRNNNSNQSGPDFMRSPVAAPADAPPAGNRQNSADQNTNNSNSQQGQGQGQGQGQRPPNLDLNPNRPSSTPSAGAAPSSETKAAIAKSRKLGAYSPTRRTAPPVAAVSTRAPVTVARTVTTAPVSRTTSSAAAPSQPPPPPPEDENAEDISSKRGLFGWETIDDKNVPTIFRHKKPHVSVRMVEEKILKSFPSSFPDKLKNAPPLHSFYITDAERRLLNEINVEHCNFEFGHAPFTSNDVVVLLEDFMKFYEQVKENCSKASQSSSTSTGSQVQRPVQPAQPAPAPQVQNQSQNQNSGLVPGGWVQINNTVAPFIRRGNARFVPLNIVRISAALNVSLNSISDVDASDRELEILNTLCKSATVPFQFQKPTQMVDLQMVVSFCRPKIEYLPITSPFHHARYVPPEKSRQASTYSSQASTSQAPRPAPVSQAPRPAPPQPRAPGPRFGAGVQSRPTPVTRMPNGQPRMGMPQQRPPHSMQQRPRAPTPVTNTRPQTMVRQPVPRPQTQYQRAPNQVSQRRPPQQQQYPNQQQQQMRTMQQQQQQRPRPAVNGTSTQDVVRRMQQQQQQQQRQNQQLRQQQQQQQRPQQMLATALRQQQQTSLSQQRPPPPVMPRPNLPRIGQPAVSYAQRPLAPRPPVPASMPRPAAPLRPVAQPRPAAPPVLTAQAAQPVPVQLRTANGTDVVDLTDEQRNRSPGAPCQELGDNVKYSLKFMPCYGEVILTLDIENHGEYCNIDELAKKYFIGLECDELTYALRNVLRVPLLKCSEQLKYNLLHNFDMNVTPHLLSLASFKNFLPQLKYMFQCTQKVIEAMGNSGPPRPAPQNAPRTASGGPGALRPAPQNPGAPRAPQAAQPRPAPTQINSAPSRPAQPQYTTLAPRPAPAGPQVGDKRPPGPSLPSDPSPSKRPRPMTNGTSDIICLD